MPVGEVKLKGIERPEILSTLYPSGLEGRHELKEATPNPAASGSRVQFSIPQIQEFCLLCLRVEVFKIMPERKASIQSNSESEDSLADSRTFYGNPDLLSPLNDTPDSDLMLVVDSLSLRIDNAATPYTTCSSTPTHYQHRGLIDVLSKTAL